MSFRRLKNISKAARSLAFQAYTSYLVHFVGNNTSIMIYSQGRLKLLHVEKQICKFVKVTVHGHICCDCMFSYYDTQLLHNYVDENIRMLT